MATSRRSIPRIVEFNAACAERRVGELIAAQKKSVGLAPAGKHRVIGTKTDPIKHPTLAEAGIDKHRADRELVPRIVAFNAAPRVLTPEERRLVVGFRALSRASRAAILTVVEGVA